jgi:hypothetical protein
MHQHPMAAYESQMAAQRSLMADAGLGINAAQPDALMHHQVFASTFNFVSVGALSGRAFSILAGSIDSAAAQSQSY